MIEYLLPSLPIALSVYLVHTRTHFTLPNVTVPVPTYLSFVIIPTRLGSSQYFLAVCVLISSNSRICPYFKFLTYIIQRIFRIWELGASDITIENI